jgi:hypothetical protein
MFQLAKTKMSLIKFLIKTMKVNTNFNSGTSFGKSNSKICRLKKTNSIKFKALHSLKITLSFSNNNCHK